ncbi:TPA: toll/interleukin-1 receptor domain-containing protein [Enterococcus faecium]|nr:toll/interleukin-1 receptor domain-containing protein [Enterococcus faecium]HAZ1008941.1 toll/interleukin-1 receptor domain-containing protein [Enterococcus faecium]HBH5991585.1 toll/interleukin-1 receptor domain-containing protein [Enterococcus faecium]
MNLEELISRGVELRKENEKNLEDNPKYISWMKNVNVFFQNSLSDSVLKKDFKNAYFFRNSNPKRQLEEVLSILCIENSKEQKEANNMKKIFISHSSKDRDIVLKFIDFLSSAFDIKKADVFCTSLNGSIEVEDEFIGKIKKEVTNLSVVIFLITKNFLESKFSLAEMGAAWALNQKIFPVLYTDTNYKDLGDTPLASLQMTKINDVNSMSGLASSITKLGLSDPSNMLEFKDTWKKYWAI